MLNKSGKADKHFLTRIHNKSSSPSHCNPSVIWSRSRLRVLIFSRRAICFGPHQDLPPTRQQCPRGLSISCLFWTCPSGWGRLFDRNFLPWWAKFTDLPQLQVSRKYPLLIASLPGASDWSCRASGKLHCTSITAKGPVFGCVECIQALGTSLLSFMRGRL
jgi:hypothetical protein